MATRPLTLDVPAPLARELEALGSDVLAEILAKGVRQWRIEQALGKYTSGAASFAAAAEGSGLSRSELAREAHARGVEPEFDEETLAEELS